MDDAKAEFNKELEVDPNNAAAHFVLGELARRAGQWDEAAEEFSRAAKLDAGFSEAYLALGMSLASARKYAEAVPPLESYVRDGARRSRRPLSACHRICAYGPEGRSRARDGFAEAVSRARNSLRPIQRRDMLPHGNAGQTTHTGDSFSRRHFLDALGWCATGAALGAPATTLAAAFEEIPPSASGIHWTHVGGLSSEMYLPETIGPGCAFLDYDNDGWMDIYLVNSGPCDFYTPPSPLRNALYRNNRDGTFTDVTEKAGVGGNAYGMGVAVGDYDGDGLPDMYVTQYARSILYHNNGDGTFTDVTEKAGVAAPGWSTSAVWFDYDNDGRLDLFVCRFADFDKSKNVFCGSRDSGLALLLQAQRLQAPAHAGYSTTTAMARSPM